MFFLCTLAAVATAERPEGTTEPPPVEWSYELGRGEGHFVQQTRDGGLIVTGWVDSGQANTDVFLAKYDSAGRNLWLQTYQGYGYNDSHCVREISGGDYIVAAETNPKMPMIMMFICAHRRQGNPVGNNIWWAQL